MKTRLRLLHLLLTVVVGPPAQAAIARVEIPGMFFHPADLVVYIGDTVRWVNLDDIPHTATADDGLWDSGVLAPGDSFSFVCDTVGIFTYHCALHPAMTGTVTVNAPPYDILINIVDFDFLPRAVRVELGTVVRWVNTGIAIHTSTAQNSAWNSGDLLTGQHFDFIFNDEGVFPYFCLHHPSMTGTVIAGRPDSIAADILIVDNYFLPDQLSLPVGSYVRWLHLGEMVHTVTSDSGLWDSSDLFPGDVYIRHMNQPGSFPYYCRYHQPMVGVITIVDTSSFVPGDANGDGQVLGSDVTYLVRYFKGTGAAPLPFLAGDANGDCNVLGSDVTYLVRYFKSIGPPPMAGNCP